MNLRRWCHLYATFHSDCTFVFYFSVAEKWSLFLNESSIDSKTGMAGKMDKHTHTHKLARANCLFTHNLRVPHSTATSCAKTYDRVCNSSAHRFSYRLLFAYGLFIWASFLSSTRTGGSSFPYRPPPFTMSNERMSLMILLHSRLSRVFLFTCFRKTNERAFREAAVAAESIRKRAHLNKIKMFTTGDG